MLNDKEKLTIAYQNQLIKQYIFDEYKISSAQISRDRNNLPLIIVHIRENHCQDLVECYTLGFNVKKNTFMLYNVGTIKTFNTNENMEIASLSVHKAFNNTGIGQVLMHYIENYASSHGYESLSLQSQKTFADFSKEQLSESELKNLPEREHVKYLTNNYYDKNLYFYTKLGFEPSGRLDPLDNFTPLKKEKLHQIVLDYGLNQPLKPVNKKNFSKPIPKKSSLHPFRYVQDYAYKDYFTYAKNEIVSEQFAPLLINPTREDLNLLAEIIVKYKKSKLHLPTRKEILDFYQNIVDRYSSPINFKLNKKHASPAEFLETIYKTLDSLNNDYNDKKVNQKLFKLYDYFNKEDSLEL